MYLSKNDNYILLIFILPTYYMENLMKNFSIKNCIFLLTFCLSTIITPSCADSDEEESPRFKSTSHCFVSSTTQLTNDQWKILIGKEDAHFITPKFVVDIKIREGKQHIIRKKSEKYCSPFDYTSKQIDAAVELITEVHVARHEDMNSLIERLEGGQTKCNCGTRHK